MSGRLVFTCGSSNQSNLLSTTKGMITSPYSWGLNKPLNSSSHTLQMNDDIPLWFDIG